MKKRVAPSAALEAAIDELVSEGLGDSEKLARYERALEARGSDL